MYRLRQMYTLLIYESIVCLYNFASSPFTLQCEQEQISSFVKQILEYPTV